VFQAGNRLDTPAWNNGIGLWSIYWFEIKVMINRDSWGHSYLIVRGEILGFIKDGLMRKHLPRMFSLIKNRKLGDQRRSDTVVVLTINYTD